MSKTKRDNETNNQEKEKIAIWKKWMHIWIDRMEDESKLVKVLTVMLNL